MSEAQQEKPTDAWGQPISEERQAELQGYLDRWAADHGDREGPFAGVELTGADIYWLYESSPQSDAEQDPILQLRGAWLMWANLEGAFLPETDLEGADMGSAELRGVGLPGANLRRANLRGANLQDARLATAHLEDADLFAAHLEGADLQEAHLEGANLVEAYFNTATNLRNAYLTSDDYGFASVAEVRWGGVNLAVANGPLRPPLGDERLTRPKRRLARKRRVLQPDAVSESAGWTRREDLGDCIAKWREAVRANRQFAIALQGQGMSEEAAHFVERAQILQRSLVLRTLASHARRPWLIPGDVGRYLFSWLLALLAGYGYRPGRTLFWYLVTIIGFTLAYLKATTGWIPFGLPHPSTFAPLTWYEALILSVSSFHGRGFFQPVQSLGDPIAALAAIEAVIGLVIEISFIATFTQRFFNSR